MAKNKSILKNLYARGAAGILYAKFVPFKGCSLVNESTGTTDPLTAQLWIANKRKELLNAPVTATTVVSNITLSRAIENTYNDVWSLNRSEWTTTAYKYSQVFLEILGDIPLESITAETLRTVRQKLRSRAYQGKRITETTVNRYLTVLRTIYTLHKDQYRLPGIKWAIKKKGVETGRIIVLSDEVLNKINAWFISKDMNEMSDLCTFLLYTGFRLSEALGIGQYTEDKKLISEFDIEKYQVHSWINKGNVSRSIPLLPKALTIAKERGTKPFLFNKDYAEYAWKKVRKALDLPVDYTLHCYRHTCASKMLAAGATLVAVQKWLGHADLATTAMYLHLMPNELNDIAARMVLAEVA